MDRAAFLASDGVVDWHHPSVREKAAELAGEGGEPAEVARRCFEFVRDTIRHSGDHRDDPDNPLTCKASDVLLYRTGWCYAKSHLLAALLRANGIPAGFCYQRLSLAGEGAPYCLHGLNAVWLDGHGWYRVDARGNKPGVDARFTPPVERLAFALNDRLERDLPEIWPAPLPVVVDALTRYASVAESLANLPDVELIG